VGLADQMLDYTMTRFKENIDRVQILVPFFVVSNFRDKILALNIIRKSRLYESG
jgi:hypothetical protein